MRRIVGRIDFYTVAMHEAIACLTCAFATDQALVASVVTSAAMHGIGKRVDGLTRTVGCSCPRHAGILSADQAVVASIGTFAASLNRSDGDFFTVAIRRSFSDFALSAVADQAVIAAVVASTAMIQIDACIAHDAITADVPETTACGARLPRGAGMAV